jgi:chitodextrinase
MSGFQQVKKHAVRADVFVGIFAKLSLPSILFLILSFAGSADAATYYVAPNGSDWSAGTSSAPWSTFSKAMSVLNPGDMLIIKDGTYHQTLNVTISGTKGNPITIRAENDGAVTVDGENVRKAINLVGTASSRKTDITIEGIVAKNSNSSVVIVQYADRINLKKVSAYQAADGNYHIFDVAWSSYVLIEDCAASGRGRVMYDIYDSDYATVRRCWGRPFYVSYAATMGIQLYGSTNCVVENNVIVKNLSYSDQWIGIQLWTATYNPAATSNNKVYGNIFRDTSNMGVSLASAQKNMTGNIFKNNVLINSNECLRHGADDNLLVENLTCVNAVVDHYRVQSYYQYYTFDPNFSVSGTLKNSSFITHGAGLYRDTNDPKYAGLTHTYNNFYGLGTNYSGFAAGTGEKTFNPSYNTATYGKGAYLMVPTALKGKGENGTNIGAEVLYRYQDGVLTDVPLWPWPMEDRIYRETGVSVTWESSGGLWKTLNGVYTAQSSPSSTTTATTISDTQAPTVPTNLNAKVVSSSQIDLTWTASTDNVGVTGYQIYKNGSLIATTNTKTAYSDTGLAASTTYSYGVAAFDAAGNVSPLSASASATTAAALATQTTSSPTPDTQPPSVPTNLAAIAASSSQIKLSWTASMDNVGVTGYRIYRNGALIATTQSTSYSNTGLSALTSYTYTVAAYDAAGNVSSKSASASAQTANKSADNRFKLSQKKR